MTDYLNPEEIAQIERWWHRVADTPMHGIWTRALALVGALAALIVAAAVLRLLYDRVGLFRLARRRAKGEQPPSKGLGYGVGGLWSQLLSERAARGHSADAETLEIIVDGRYDWVNTGLGVLKATATLTGLFFTFLGLAFGLDALGDAMGAADRESDILTVLGQVKDALPSLGTAFASSVCGVLIAIGIGLADGILAAWRASFTARLMAFSAAWIEPASAPPTSDDALMNLGNRLAETSRDLASVVESNRQVSADFQGVAGVLEAIPKATREAWAGIMDSLSTHHQQVVGDLDGLLEGARDGASAHLERLSEVSAGLGEASERLQQRIGQAAHDLEVSGDAVTQLAGAAELFGKAFGQTTNLVQSASLSQSRMLAKVEDTFGLVPPLAEAVTLAAANTAEAASRMETVLSGEDMARYLQHLPKLAALAESEQASREALQGAMGSLSAIATVAETLEQQVERLGNTAEHLERAYDGLGDRIRALTDRDDLMPLVGLTVEKAVEKAVQGWGKSHELLLLRQTAALEALAAAQREQAQAQSSLNDALRRSWLGRLVGR